MPITAPLASFTVTVSTASLLLSQSQPPPVAGRVKPVADVPRVQGPPIARAICGSLTAAPDHGNSAVPCTRSMGSISQATGSAAWAAPAQSAKVSRLRVRTGMGAPVRRRR